MKKKYISKFHIELKEFKTFLKEFDMLASKKDNYTQWHICVIQLWRDFGIFNGIYVLRLSVEL